jgi:hypothetical protein
MSIRATISTHYRLRLALMFLILGGFGSWFLYDGFVTYPREVAVWTKWEELVKAGEVSTRWPTLVAEAGYPEASLEKPPKRRTAADTLIQKLLGGLVLPLGLMFGFLTLRTFAQWVELREDGLHASTGAHIPWEQLLKLDKTRWKSKGIAIVHGREGSLVLDDWKFDRDTTEVILRTVEDNIQPAQIVGGEREPASTPDPAAPSNTGQPGAGGGGAPA